MFYNRHTEYNLALLIFYISVARMNLLSKGRVLPAYAQKRGDNILLDKDILWHPRMIDPRQIRRLAKNAKQRLGLRLQ